MPKIIASLITNYSYKEKVIGVSVMSIVDPTTFYYVVQLSIFNHRVRVPIAFSLDSLNLVNTIISVLSEEMLILGKISVVKVITLT